MNHSIELASFCSAAFVAMSEGRSEAVSARSKHHDQPAVHFFSATMRSRTGTYTGALSIEWLFSLIPRLC